MWQQIRHTVRHTVRHTRTENFNDKNEEIWKQVKSISRRCSSGRENRRVGRRDHLSGNQFSREKEQRVTGAVLTARERP